MGVGGPAPFFLLPRDAASLAALVGALTSSGERFRVLGAGSNLIVSDAGVKTPVISTERLTGGVVREGNRLRAGAGMLLPRLVREAATHGLSGLEFAEGIPGSVGGGLRMNAGAGGRWMGDVVREVLVVTPSGSLERRTTGPGDFGYRRSFIAAGDLVAVEAVFEGSPDDPEAIRERMRDSRAYRVSTQPLSERSSGCIFRNPEGGSAGEILDRLGLKGLSVGGAVRFGHPRELHREPRRHGRRRPRPRGAGPRRRARPARGAAAVRGRDLEGRRVSAGGTVLEERRDQHYLRRPGNLAVRRHRQRRGALRWILLLTVQVAVVGAVVVIGRQAYLSVVTSSRFEVKTIAVRGNDRARTGDLLALAAPAVGRNIFRVDLDALRGEVLRSPWVLDAAVRKSLPSTVEIAVTEREPAAIASFEGRAWLVDGTGRRLAEYGPEFAAYDFPVLTGIEALPRADAVRRIREGASAVAALAAAAPALAKRISEIDLSVPDRLAVHLADGSPVLLLDNQEPLRNLDHLAEVQGLLGRQVPVGSRDEPARIACVDLRFRGRIAVMPETTEENQQP